jgi:transcription initiation factor TFIIIB Brf1 subunit/transcription initiation factor TFIIB
MGPKIATCSYCGTRAALILDQGRHELVCSACGAPLHDMKAMPKTQDAPRKNRPAGATPKRSGPRRRVKVDWAAERAHALGDERKRKTRRKSRKSLAYRVLDELWDGIEDIFD